MSKTKIDQARHLTLAGPITTEAVAEVVTQLNGFVLESNNPIYLTISSPGGETSAGLWAADYIRSILPKVITIAAGAVYSAALTIYSAGDERWSYPSTGFFLHPVQAEYEIVSFGDLRATSEMYVHLNERCEDLESQAFNWTKEEFLNKVRNCSHLNVPEAIAAGLVHRIIEPRARAV